MYNKRQIKYIVKINKLLQANNVYHENHSRFFTKIVVRIHLFGVATEFMKNSMHLFFIYLSIFFGRKRKQYYVLNIYI